jgi:hypothetical protein
MDKESGIRKKAQRGTQERRYEEETQTEKVTKTKKVSAYIYYIGM